jgi:hypothetical protein
MQTLTITSFQQVIDRHKSLIAAILREGGLDDLDAVSPERFVEHVSDSAHVLDQSSLWVSDHEAMESARVYLADASQLADGDPAKAVLLGKASSHLDSIDETDFDG